MLSTLPSFVADSVSPLSDSERQILLAAFRADQTMPSKLTHFHYSTGAHPAVASDPKHWRLRVEDGNVVWNRPKTRAFVAVPIDPEISGWLSWLIDYLEAAAYHPVTINKLVASFGQKIGLPGLRPRGLRHDFCYRAVQSWGMADARTLTGTSLPVLMSYAARDLAKRASKDPRGLFG